MSSALFLLILGLSVHFSLLLFSFPSAFSSSALSTIAVSHVGNQTLVCVLLPSINDGPYGLNCTSLPSGKSRTYRSRGAILYSAIAAGNGFLCAISSPQDDPSTSIMRWWEFSDNHDSSKRVYKGPSLSGLAASDSHVCGLIGNSGDPNCWRWPQLSIPPGLSLAIIAVGGDFVCGLSNSSVARCFGGNASGVIGNEPKGAFAAIAAGTQHACAVSVSGKMACWGAEAPPETAAISDISSMTVGDGRTCAIRFNGTVACFGDGAELPPGFETLQFMAVEARGRVFCGVLMVNYSVICWGSDIFRRNPVVFKRALPGSCSAISSCRCGILPGSGNVCSNGGGICQPCPRLPPHIPAMVTPPATRAASSGDSNSRRRLLFIVLGSIGFGIGCVASASFLILRARNCSGRVHDSDRLQPQAAAYDPNIDVQLSSLFRKGPGPAVEEYPIETLLAATDGFAERHKIGSGGFGSVYRATLPDGRVVAIKRAKPPPVTTRSASTSRSVPQRHRQREAAFLAELSLLSRVNHKNLVRLHGFCHKGAELILVYEFIMRGNLDVHLRSPGLAGSPLGSWAGRIRVALDAARGIEYLHTYAVPAIIHRDIKSSNILLDDSWTAKVSDFGLSLLKPEEGEEEVENGGSAAAGTVGYIDPEYYRTRHLTIKSDVYSFGVVLLELLSGCRAVERDGESETPMNVVEYAVPRIEADEVHNVLDGRLPPPTPCEIEAVIYVGYLAADCVCPAGRDRPTMSEVVAGLERALSTCDGAPELLRSSSEENYG